MTPAARELPVTFDVRRLLLEMFRERDRQDAEQWRGRSSVYALRIERLESEADVYESYQVLEAAGVELSEETRASITALSADWRSVCRIDCEGKVWTASLREKNRSSW